MDAKILLLDPPAAPAATACNEFHIPYQGNDLMILRNGGTVNLDSIGTWNQPANGLLDILGSYGQPSVDFLAYCGVDYNNFPSTAAAGIPGSFGLRGMLLFPSEDWGTDTVIQNRVAPEPWPTFLARTPFTPDAQAGHRPDPDRHDLRLDRTQARAEDRPGEEGDPGRDHAEAVLHGLRRCSRAVDALVPA